MTLKIQFVKTREDARIPTYATDGSGCFDLYGVPSNELTNTKNTKIYLTGLQVKVPVGHVMLIFSRSGHGFKSDIRLSNCVGVIDSDYRGEVKVKLRNDDGSCILPFSSIASTHAIAQAMVIPAPLCEFIEVDNLDCLGKTARGGSGFGSTDQTKATV